YYKAYHDLPGGIDAGTDSTAATDYLVLSNSGIGFGGREDDFRSFGYVDLASRGRGESFGAELLVKKKFSEVPCYGQLSVAVSKTGYRAANQKWYPGQFDQRMILGLSGGYVINPRWELSARFRLISGAPYTPAYDPRSNTANPGQVRNLPDEYLSRRLPWTHQLDMRVDRRWNFSGWALITFLDVQDVYNQRVPQPPTWNFEDERIENRNAIGILPALGVSAIF
ncbi:MAG: TonB-dependent receptor, partial [Candidatus Eisenbacteria bacterium]